MGDRGGGGARGVEGINAVLRKQYLSTAKATAADEHNGSWHVHRHQTRWCLYDSGHMLSTNLQSMSRKRVGALTRKHM
jgi:hypothetical protein